MAIKGRPTKHAGEDRLDRITAIAMTIGFGQVIKERQMEENKWYQVTDTGIMIVRTPNKEAVITMWTASQRQVAEVYGDERVPETLKNRMRANKKKFPEVYAM